MTDEERSPEEEFRELIRQMLSGTGGQISAEQLSQLSGMQVDPAMLSQMMRQLQGAFTGSGDSISWDAATQQALHIANEDAQPITEHQREELRAAFTLANLWLGESTAVSELSDAPRAITRGEWVEQTLPVWQELAEPVATSIADALTQALREQVPEEMQELVQSAGRMLRTLGGSLFAAQLGQVVGNLAKEVASGGDVGIPLMPAGVAATLPQNFADRGESLEIPQDQLALYITTRELAHARLFRHAKWLRLHVISQVTDFARGIHVDTSMIEELASRFDPNDTDELRRAIESGQLLPERTPTQNAALSRLENLLALIEGWVDVVTQDATSRLPSADRIAEAVRRRRAVGGPAERALGGLVGLELRPRRMREAAAMWRAVTDAVGIAGRDALWDYPDMMPSSEDIDDPAALVARLQALASGEAPVRDEMDEALDALLAQGLSEAADTDDDPPADHEAGADQTSDAEPTGDAEPASDADAEGNAAPGGNFHEEEDPDNGTGKNPGN